MIQSLIHVHKSVKSHVPTLLSFGYIFFLNYLTNLLCDATMGMALNCSMSLFSGEFFAAAAVRHGTRHDNPPEEFQWLLREACSGKNLQKNDDIALCTVH